MATKLESQSLHFVENLTCYLRCERGWIPHLDYRTLQEAFWFTFQDKVGGLSREIMMTIKIASIMGLLLCRN